MARVRINSALKAMRGELNGLVYKTFKTGGGCVARKARSNGENTEARQAANERWRQALAYASIVWQDPAGRAFYEALAKRRKAWRAYNLATQDYLNPPLINRIDIDGYRGAPGGSIKVQSIDDVGVVSVHVEIRDVGGRVWESGVASNAPGIHWCYVATQAIPEGTELEIEVVAEDRPGNRTLQWRKLIVPRPRRTP